MNLSIIHQAVKDYNTLFRQRSNQLCVNIIRYNSLSDDNLTAQEISSDTGVELSVVKDELAKESYYNRVEEYILSKIR